MVVPHDASRPLPVAVLGVVVDEPTRELLLEEGQQGAAHAPNHNDESTQSPEHSKHPIPESSSRLLVEELAALLLMAPCPQDRFVGFFLRARLGVGGGGVAVVEAVAFPLLLVVAVVVVVVDGVVGEMTRCVDEKTPGYQSPTGQFLP